MAMTFDMKNMSWENMLKVTDETIAAIDGGDRETARAFLQALAAKKTADRRTWGRMSLLAQDALGKFDESDTKRVKEVILALRAIVTVVLKGD